MKHTLIAICVILFSLLSCNNQNNNNDPLKGLELKLTDNTNTSCKDNIKLIYSFDGNCSACILDFIQWLKQWNNYSNNEIKCYFISKSRDIYHVEYYLDKFEVKLSQNQYLTADSSKIFWKNNELIDSYQNPLLLDKNNRILTSKNPFESRSARRIYKSYGLTQNK
jgi:hypothetical protein